jgi:hypothetical protein
MILLLLLGFGLYEKKKTKAEKGARQRYQEFGDDEHEGLKRGQTGGGRREMVAWFLSRIGSEEILCEDWTYMVGEC